MFLNGNIVRSSLTNLLESWNPRDKLRCSLHQNCSWHQRRGGPPASKDIRDFPSSAEGAIEIDEIRRDLRVAVGKIIFALQQLGLCRDDIQEVDRTLLITLPGGLQSCLIFSDGPGNICTQALRFM